jgi:hypothetical protein
MFLGIIISDLLKMLHTLIFLSLIINQVRLKVKSVNKATLKSNDFHTLNSAFDSRKKPFYLFNLMSKVFLKYPNSASC